MILALISCGLLKAQQTNGRLIVKVGYFIPLKGNLVVSLYDSLGRLNGAPIQIKSIPVISEQEIVVFEKLPAGRYGVSAFHDVNENGTLEFANEDYGNSNGAVARYGAPKFEQISFYFDDAHNQIFVPLENERANTNANYEGRSIVTPLFGYSPETSVMLGAGLIKIFRLGTSDNASRTSTINIMGAATFRKQILTGINYTVFSNRGDFIFTGNTGFQNCVLYYFGTGNDVPIGSKELIHYNQIIFEHSLLLNIYKKLYAGIGYHYLKVYDIEEEDTHLLENSRIPGYNGVSVSGIQFYLAADNRNNINNTSKGHLISLKYGVYNSMLGSRYNFTSFEADMRGFLKLRNLSEDILALQVYTYFSQGSVPWREMGALGNDRIMRGYYSGQFRDQNYIAAQAEYRKAFNKFVGAVLFAGTGEVASALNQFNIKGLKPNAGIGFRLKMDRTEKLNLRMDLGFGKSVSNFYLGFAEAF